MKQLFEMYLADYKKYENVFYFLYSKWEIVYIGESWKWLQRMLWHIHKKEFDMIKCFEAPADPLKRKIQEWELIEKYNPRYNKKIQHIAKRQESLWYVNIEKIKRDKKIYKPNYLKKFVIRNCVHKVVWSALYVKYSDYVEKILDHVRANATVQHNPA